ncbi:MAG TPA: formylglycine-generating enzyme family protein [Beijerinckiaceae bacterium]|nr:formylglycine-generating enzyme family protein [Beijerinckiaceae bacterium]
MPTSCIADEDRPGSPKAGMVWVARGTFRMGSDAAWPEERPPRPVTVDGFWIDRHHVTNAQFARFVAATGYVTFAERRDPRSGVANGSLVFSQPRDIRDLQDIGQWWRLVPGANWRHPEGPGSGIAERQHHPVVHVAYEDAAAYAAWAGRELPTEEQWEFAARGGREGALYTWGDERDTGEAPLANRWHGTFPLVNTGSRGFRGTSPVGCFPANGYGLYDMAGNVWQWTRSVWTDDHAAPQDSSGSTGERVIKGGSFLCAPNYCMRFRPAARQPGEPGSSTSHIGFRTVHAGAPPPGG